MNQGKNEMNLISKNVRIIIVAVIMIAVVYIGGIYLQKNHEGLLDKDPIPYVSWDEAVQIVNSGQVKEVVQTAHNYDVTLILKNGTSIKTKESRLDEIVGAKVKCGSLCNDILFSVK
ncbi:MAG: hypothetical protein Q7J35_17565 [Candidatus Methanoperedens sp.]|nr:hypothetical protein [Candidatus Methanoperedens sp.]